MKIYVSHSSSYDYINEIYNPIINSDISKTNTFFIPHENKNKITNTKDIIASYDLVIAEVSLPSTGQGIELGWASYANVHILCVYKKGSKISTSIKFITTNFIEYENSKDMIEKIKEFISK